MGLLERIVSVMLQNVVRGICNIKRIITALTWLGVNSGTMVSINFPSCVFQISTFKIYHVSLLALEKSCQGV